MSASAAGIAHRLAADLARRADVSFHQRRRHGEHVRHVVEAVAHVVGRQQRRDIHVDRQQVADGVGVLGAIQPVQRRPARIGMRGGGLIDGRSRARRRTPWWRPHRAAACPAAASARRAACGSLFRPARRSGRDAPGPASQDSSRRWQLVVVAPGAVAVDHRPDLEIGLEIGPARTSRSNRKSRRTTAIFASHFPLAS